MSFHIATILKLTMLVCLLVCSCNCQLNFSTGWGKRGLVNAGTTSSAAASSAAAGTTNCKASVDSLMMIYKLIQNEAQKLIDCDKFSY